MRLSAEMSAHWFKLPLSLRKRWWDETAYGKKEPSAELKVAVFEAIELMEGRSGENQTDDKV
jgi:hypothetical protein